MHELAQLPDLTLQAEQLSRSISFWNTAIIFLMVCAAASATGLFIAQGIAFRKADKLLAVTNEISRIKEVDANERISAADVRASNAAKGASDAQANVEVLKKEASDSKAAQQQTELELQKQKEITTVAQVKLFELEKRQAPRTLVKGELSSLLKGKATGTYKIWYQPDDMEAYNFGQSLIGELQDAGWKNNGMERIPEGSSLMSAWPAEARKMITPSALEAERRLLPVSMRSGAMNGLGIITHSLKDSAFKALYDALLKVNNTISAIPNYDLPENVFIVVVGQKPMPPIHP
jgi:hypothetical protein